MGSCNYLGCLRQPHGWSEFAISVGMSHYMYKCRRCDTCQRLVNNRSWICSLSAPADTKCAPNAVIMLYKRLRRWPSIRTRSGKSLVSADFSIEGNWTTARYDDWHFNASQQTWKVRQLFTFSRFLYSMFNRLLLRAVYIYIPTFFRQFSIIRIVCDRWLRNRLKLILKYIYFS